MIILHHLKGIFYCNLFYIFNMLLYSIYKVHKPCIVNPLSMMFVYLFTCYPQKNLSCKRVTEAVPKHKQRILSNKGSMK